MAESHLCTIKVEEIHELYGLSLAQSAVVDAPWLVVQLETDREYLGALCVKMSGTDIHAKPVDVRR